MVKLYNSFNINKNHKQSIILIGNFDGVHLGHQRLFKLAKSYKKRYNLKDLHLLYLCSNYLQLIEFFYSYYL